MASFQALCHPCPYKGHLPSHPIPLTSVKENVNGIWSIQDSNKNLTNLANTSRLVLSASPFRIFPSIFFSRTTDPTEVPTLLKLI